jgi:hypothetical protein
MTSFKSSRAPRGGEPARRAHIELNHQIGRLENAAELCALIAAKSTEFNYVKVATEFANSFRSGSMALQDMR